MLILPENFKKNKFLFKLNKPTDNQRYPHKFLDNH